MASIQTHLQGLEARLAPALDAQALQERLTEAENHLRDRAQEFEEVGLPSHEAEARAVAAFGAPEEYAEDAPILAAPPAAKPRTPPKAPRRDLALQLAWSMVGMGVVAMVAYEFVAGMVIATVVAVFGLGALFGRPTRIRRMGVLAVASAAAAFLVMVGFYEPVPSSGYRTERIGVRLRGARSDADWAYQDLTRSLERFQRARVAHDHGETPATVEDFDFSPPQTHSRYTGPSLENPDEYGAWRGGIAYNLGLGGLKDYRTAEEADRAWKRDGDAVQARLQDAAAKAKPIDPELSETAFAARCGLVALMGGVAFLASMVGAQALALMLRGLFAALFGGRRVERTTRFYPEPERP